METFKRIRNKKEKKHIYMFFLIIIIIIFFFFERWDIIYTSLIVNI